MNQLNAIIAAVAVVVVSAVLVIGVLVPVIDSGSYDKTKVDNTPLTYEAYLQGSALSGADIAISVADGDLNITLNGTVFSTSVASMTYRSVLVSDGINVQVNNGVLDVYCPDGAYYADAVSVSKTSNRFTVIDSDNRVHDCPVPSYCYISIGTSDAAKTIQRAALYAQGDGTILDGSSQLVMIGGSDGTIGVSDRSTVSGYIDNERTGGIAISDGHGTAVPDSSAVIGTVDVGGQTDYTVQSGEIKGTTS